MDEGLLAQAFAAHRAGDLATAERLYRELLARQPDHVDALQLLGAAELQQGRATEALACFERVLALPGDPPAAMLSNRAAALRELGRADEALASLDVLLAKWPDDARALNNRAAALLDLQRPDAALASVDRSLALDPRDAAAQHNRGRALLALGRSGDALAACDAALALDGRAAATRLLRGQVLMRLGRQAAALDDLDQVLRNDPQHLHALIDRGNVLLELGRAAEAMASYRRALDIAPDMPFLFGQWLLAKLTCCDWRGLDAAFGTLARGVDAGAAIAPPYVGLFAPLSAAQQQNCARAFAGTLRPLHPTEALLAPPAPDGRIRIGYFSADFRSHALSQLCVGVFECHRRDRFEVTAFSFGPADDDPLSGRVRAAFERFIDVSEHSDEAIVALARSLPIDIAVDLGGYTRHARPGIFARRAAPLQLSWVGYPGTLGAPFIDYLVADTTVLPVDRPVYADERLIRLPHCYLPSDGRRAIDARTPTRAELGLPADGMVFCAFHRAVKITPAVFDVWMHLLRRLPGSVLWLSDLGQPARAQLQAAAEQRGVEPARLVFAPRLAPAALYLARQRAADLALDTWPYNGHTTTSDALWAGLPLLTCCGDGFAARVAASLLRAVGLPELITESPAAYERLAFELATDAPRLMALRERLAQQRDTAPLFDTPRFTRGLEAAYSAIWARRVAGLPNADLEVRDDTRGDVGVVEDAAVTEPARGVQARRGQ